MATSGNITLVASRDTIITEALSQLGAVDGVGPADPNDVASMAISLNFLIKWLQAKAGLNLFALQRIALMLEKDKRFYNLGPNGDHFTPESGLRRLTTTASLLAGVSVIPVNDATGVLAADEIGIVQEDGVHWTTVVSVLVNDITITDVTTADVANAAAVFNFTGKGNRPMKIMDVVTRRFDNTLDVPVEVIDRERYITLSNKEANGQVNQVYYDPQVGTGKLFVWPIELNLSQYLVLYVQRTLENVDASADDVDFPQEWFLPLVYNLAKMNTAKFGITSSESTKINRLADETLDEAFNWDREEDIRIQPDDRWRYDE